MLDVHSTYIGPGADDSDVRKFRFVGQLDDRHDTFVRYGSDDIAYGEDLIAV